MGPVQDTTRHTCCHCESIVLTTKGCTPLELSSQDPKGVTKWKFPLKHSPDGVKEAARSGCPFFVTLWRHLDTFRSSQEEMEQTALSFVLEAVRIEQTPVVESRKSVDSHPLAPTTSHLSQEIYDITRCTMVVEIQGHTRPPFTFTALSEWDDPSANHALARLIDGHTTSSQAMGQVRRRLQYCLAHHDNCKDAFSSIRPGRYLSIGCSTNPTIKVIQAQNLDKGLGVTEPYAALSYCWGQDQMFKLTSVNMTDMEDNIPLHLLPKTITDAIRITRELGIKFLWVDSLCLVQDNDLAAEVANMHHYYGNSYITISAVTATSCNEGFLSDRPTARTDQHADFGPFYFPVDLGVPENPSYLKLVGSMFGRQAPIDARAWTLQEGLLSHRLISFTPRTVRWSCQTESYGNRQFDSLRELRDSLVAVRYGTYGECHRPIHDHSGSEVEELYGYKLARAKLKVWSKIVENYTTRALSKEGDKLPAISGIASVLSASPNDSSILGHKIDFMAGLFVYSSQGSLVHRPSAMNTSGLEIQCRPRNYFESGLLALQLLWVQGAKSRMEPRPTSYIAPSWSWASSRGAISTECGRVRNDLFDYLMGKVWEQGLRVRDVCAIPSNAEAPYGALAGGSITLDGVIFVLDEQQDGIGSVIFDRGRWSDATGDYNGLFCLEIIPRLRECPPKVRHSVHPMPEDELVFRVQGLVLQVVEPEGQFQSDQRVFRRVGVYRTSRQTQYYDSSSGEDVSKRWVETITII